ncbi:MAG: ABC transporter ATP-binding protein [Actinobacteria bacterium QS_5_72_10]|nr:MAG: ABC transporter ATP-binding protein [Actinobacteria bacterium QS_5_72_10]
MATDGLTKRYEGATVVDTLSVEVAAGEVFGLLGPNGAGKTTTILMLLGLTEPSAGTVRVCGFDPTRQALAVRRRVGYLPDDVGFYSTLTGRQNLGFTARLNRLNGETAQRRIDELLTRVGLLEAADSRVATYSKGMRQRLGIADVLIKDPEVVVLDEPTAGIDPRGTVEVLELVEDLAAEGVTVLLASHLLQQVQQTCHRIGIFVGGGMVASGTVDELAAELGTGRIELEVGVAGDPAGGPGRWRVTARRDDRAAIAGRLAEAGLGLTHLRRRGDDLDDVYLRYFSAETDSGQTEDADNQRR